mgnify:CR=1 FL=1
MLTHIAQSYIYCFSSLSQMLQLCFSRLFLLNHIVPHYFLFMNRQHVTFKFAFIWEGYITDTASSVHLHMLLFLHFCIKLYVAHFTFPVECYNVLFKTLFVEQYLTTFQTFSFLVIFYIIMLLFHVYL